MKTLIFKLDLLKNDIAVLTDKLSKISSRFSFNLESKVLRVEAFEESKVNSIIEVVQNTVEVLRITIEDESHKANGNLFDISTLEFNDENVKKIANKIYWLLYNKSISDNKVMSDIIELLASLSIVGTVESENASNKILDDTLTISGNEALSEQKGKILSGNKLILSVIEPKIEKIGRNLPLEEKVSAFLDAIEFENDEVIKKAFVISNSICESPKEKLSYEKLIPQIIESTSMKNPDKIKEHFISCFKNWVNKYPEVVNKNGRENLISLIRVFYKFFGRSIDNQSYIEPVLNCYDDSEILNIALSKLDVSKPYQSQIETFMHDIDMPNDDFIKKMFLIACEIKKANSDNIAYQLEKIYPKMHYNEIISKMKNVHEDWLSNHPAFKEKYGKKTMIYVINMFAKNFK